MAKKSQSRDNCELGRKLLTYTKDLTVPNNNSRVVGNEVRSHAWLRLYKRYIIYVQLGAILWDQPKGEQEGNSCSSVEYVLWRQEWKQ